MHGKEFVIDCVRSFFAVVTMITAAMFILGFLFAPEEQFGYEVFLFPLIYGTLGTLPNLVMYSKRILTIKEVIIRKVLQLLLIEAMIIVFIFGFSRGRAQEPEVIAGVAISVFVIYVLCTIIDWLQNYFTAKHMTEDLMKFQESVN